MIISVEGNEATGKSTLLHTAPLPIVSVSLDMGFDRAVYGALYDKFFKGLAIAKVKYKPGAKAEKNIWAGQDITVFEIPAPIQLDHNRIRGYMDIWEYWLQVYVEALQDPAVATIGVDTMTLLTRYKRDAYLEELQKKSGDTGPARKQLQQIEYGHPDGQIRSIFTYAQAMGKNLVVTHHLRDVYGPGMKDGRIEQMPTGESEHDGVRDVMKFVDVQLRNTKKQGQVISKFIKCGPNLSYEGMEVPGLTWDKLVDMLALGWHGPEFQRRQEKVEG